MKKNDFKIILTLSLLGLSLVFIFLIYPKIINNYAEAQSKDAIAIRVIPNPNHISAQRWYGEQGFSGSPQAIIVDGYEGIRDGRTVYVNAANILNPTAAYDPNNPDNPNGPQFFTNIYLISYNQQAEKSTVDIFGQIVSHWQFNTNLAKGKDNQDNDAVCSGDTNLKCITDKDCAGNGYCSSFKAQVTRDTIRLARLNDIDTKLKQYGQVRGSYPQLSAGTYLPKITFSTWPSWQDNFAKELGGSLPVDPINKFADCSLPAGYATTTCWNESEKKFRWSLDGIPDNSHVFRYQATSTNTYELCAFAETPFITNSCNSECIPMCFDRACGFSGCKDADNKDIYCGTCTGDSTCNEDEGRCYTDCPSSGGIYAGCKDLDKLDNAYVVPGKCTNADEKCYKCNPGYSWNGSICVGSPCKDNDGDGYGVAGATTGCNYPDADCKDDPKTEPEAANIHPGAKEICDNKDNNCDGTVDENCDRDSDTYCDCNQTINISNTRLSICPGTDPSSANSIKNSCDCNDNPAVDSKAPNIN
ncbi:MAG: MopE-related protein, partial [Patescibacteria group bacterium]